MTKQSFRRTPKRHKSQASAHVERLRAEIAEAHETIQLLAQKLSEKNRIIRRLTE